MRSLCRLTSADEPLIRRFWIEHWGSSLVVSRGKIYTPEGLDGFSAVEQEAWIGLVTFSIAASECEIVSLDSLREAEGTGTALIEAVTGVARQAGCARVFLITTNDNMRALRFYQKRGFELVAVYRNEMDVVRRHKPEVPLIGLDGIPLRDEIELELPLKMS